MRRLYPIEGASVLQRRNSVRFPCGLVSSETRPLLRVHFALLNRLARAGILDIGFRLVIPKDVLSGNRNAHRSVANSGRIFFAHIVRADWPIARHCELAVRSE